MSAMGPGLETRGNKAEAPRYRPLATDERRAQLERRRAELLFEIQGCGFWHTRRKGPAGAALNAVYRSEYQQELNAVDAELRSLPLPELSEEEQARLKRWALISYWFLGAMFTAIVILIVAVNVADAT